MDCLSAPFYFSLEEKAKGGFFSWTSNWFYIFSWYDLLGISFCIFLWGSFVGLEPISAHIALSLSGHLCGSLLHAF